MRPFEVSWATLDSLALHVFGLALSFLVAFFLAPVAIRKLRGARIVGNDRHKPDRPEVAEMGGLIVFAGFMAGVFALLMVTRLGADQKSLLLATLVTACGAALTGVLDDMIALRQRFKAFLPLGFAVPLALFVSDTTIAFPGGRAIDFTWLYPVVLVPLGITCAANGFNMLEGFNGLGTGLGIILTLSMAVLAIASGHLLGLVLLVPLLGALLAFLNYNFHPAKVFPGDTMTLLVGAVLAAAAILSKLEFWGLLLFLPHVIEFFLKAASRFNAQSFASRLEGTDLVHEGPYRSLTHVAMGRRPISERALVGKIWGFEAAWAAIVVAAALGMRGG